VKKAVIPRDKKRHGGYSDRRQADFYVLGVALTKKYQKQNRYQAGEIVSSASAVMRCYTSHILI
jgi:hypothetical protein